LQIALQNTAAFPLFTLEQLQRAPSQEQNIFIFTNINTTVDQGECACCCDHCVTGFSCRLLSVIWRTEILQ
jgi:hypothetical protein